MAFHAGVEIRYTKVLGPGKHRMVGLRWRNLGRNVNLTNFIRINRHCTAISRGSHGLSH